MIQFYLLSILLNALAGYALTLESESRPGLLAGIRELLHEETIRLVLGVLTMAVGFFKILSVVRGDIPVVGDFIPALCGLASGFGLLFDFYRSRTSLMNETTERMDLIFVKNRKWIGYAAMIGSVTHFLFPAVIFL